MGRWLASISVWTTLAQKVTLIHQPYIGDISISIYIYLYIYIGDISTYRFINQLIHQNVWGWPSSIGPVLGLKVGLTDIEFAPDDPKRDRKDDFFFDMMSFPAAIVYISSVFTCFLFSWTEIGNPSLDFKKNKLVIQMWLLLCQLIIQISSFGTWLSLDMISWRTSQQPASSQDVRETQLIFKAGNSWEIWEVGTIAFRILSRNWCFWPS